MMWAKMLGGAMALGILAGCQIKPQIEKTQLTGDELRALFVGKTVESYSLSSGATSFSYYYPDGRVEQVRYWESREGRWKISDDNQICLSMEDKDFSCRPVFREGDRYYKYRLEGDQWVKILRYRQFLDGRYL
ncbi:hypothetical protein GCM10011352_33580 [Marinobacterium zhoushanense]|uniref:Lipoprotein n=1 Tax=Marinobacterium zhoushanense TaxID=1679163 RepID=A0ABQ1KRT8_9GAMM|nr:hypothetical protein [Marinobacterium zhoushanense]GGC04664.1 hypothetical protein GCM10011352_33580 [Marinobacterium zhoushanense]